MGDGSKTVNFSETWSLLTLLSAVVQHTKTSPNLNKDRDLNVLEVLKVEKDDPYQKDVQNRL